MADKISKDARSKNMASIRSKGTKPEMVVRSLIHSLGYRYRLYAKDLPGKPDLVFRSRGKVIFVHGCFWHQHDKAECLDGRMPKSQLDYWRPKLERNVERDAHNQRALQQDGWQVLTIWECEIGNRIQLERTIRGFLDG